LDLHLIPHQARGTVAAHHEGVSVYLSAIATHGHKGFYVSWPSASQQVAVMFAALLGAALSSTLPPQKMMLDGACRCFWVV
jgi:hypothetical protein